MLCSWQACFCAFHLPWCHHSSLSVSLWALFPNHASSDVTGVKICSSSSVTASLFTRAPLLITWPSSSGRSFAVAPPPETWPSSASSSPRPSPGFPTWASWTSTGGPAERLSFFLGCWNPNNHFGPTRLSRTDACVLMMTDLLGPSSEVCRHSSRIASCFYPG